MKIMLHSAVTMLKVSPTWLQAAICVQACSIMIIVHAGVNMQGVESVLTVADEVSMTVTYE